MPHVVNPAAVVSLGVCPILNRKKDQAGNRRVLPEIATDPSGYFMRP